MFMTMPSNIRHKESSSEDPFLVLHFTINRVSIDPIKTSENNGKYSGDSVVMLQDNSAG